MLPVVAAALAGLLLVGTAPETHVRRLDPVRQRSTRAVPRWGLAAGAVFVLVSLVGFQSLGWLVAASVALGTVGWLVMGHRRRRERARRAEHVARAARVLAALLRIGQVPRAALTEAAADCLVLRSAAAAAVLGTDVAAEFERMSVIPGHEGLRSVAAAWRISERSGAPVADLLADVAENLRRRRQLQATIDAELSAARTSGNIMAALPFLALGLGYVVGADPLAVLLSGVLGQIIVVTGVCLTSAGVLWIDHLANREGRRT